MLRRIVRDGGFRAVKVCVGRIFLNGGGFRPGQALLALKAEILWARADHAGVREIALKLVENHRSPVGYYYLAQSSYVHGDLPQAVNRLRELVKGNPDHADGIYLLAKCIREMGDKKQAWAMLEKLAAKSPRLKTWQCLANMVDNEKDFDQLLLCHQEALRSKILPVYQQDVLTQLSHAALRCGNYSHAKATWRKIVTTNIRRSKKIHIRKPRVDIYSVNRAEQALIDLKKVLDDAGIGFFLISGTLLGCIREGQLLGHDKDIDVGIWEDVPVERLNSTIRKAGYFFTLPSRSHHIVRIRHLNGIPIDLFYHYKEQGDYWHGGVKSKWHNSPFDLVETRFLNQTFLIPSNPDVYLRENYGDWKTPQSIFDSAFDTPNIEITQPDELTVYTLRMLHSCHNKKNVARIEYYLGKLEELGEHELVREFRQGTGIPLHAS